MLFVRTGLSGVPARLGATMGQGTADLLDVAAGGRFEPAGVQIDVLNPFTVPANPNAVHMIQAVDPRHLPDEAQAAAAQLAAERGHAAGSTVWVLSQEVF